MRARALQLSLLIFVLKWMPQTLLLKILNLPAAWNVGGIMNPLKAHFGYAKFDGVAGGFALPMRVTIVRQNATPHLDRGQGRRDCKLQSQCR